MKNRIKIIVNLLEKVSTCAMEPEQALSLWPDIEAEKDELVAEGWHELTHFHNDLDIRNRDAVYDEHMKSCLMNYAKKLKEKYKIL